MYKSNNKSLKIARVIDIFYPYVSGVANQAYFISKYLQENGIQSPIFTSKFYAENSKSYEIIDGIEVHRINYLFHIMKFIITPKIKEILMNSEFSLIHSHNYRNYLTNIAVKVAKKKRKPIVLSVHGSLLNYQKMVFGIKRSPYRMYDIIFGKKEIENIDKIIVNSKIEEESALLFGVPKQKIKIIPVGIIFSKYQKEVKKICDDKILQILFVGRISPVRNLELIIYALKNMKNVHLTIVGGEVSHTGAVNVGYLNNLKILSNNLKLNDKITFLGPKYGEELVKEYKKADIFIYTSFVENFGQTILEAAASGLPIISTPVGIANEIVNDGKTGFIVDFKNPKEITKKINILRNASLRKEFSRSISKIAKEKFDWTHITNNYIKLYEECLDKS